MFGGIGWAEIFILLLAGLIILGPERLPGAITFVMGLVRKTRDYLTGATEKIKEELGSEFDQIVGPLQEVKKLRSMTPGALFTEHVLGGKSIQEHFQQTQLYSDSDFDSQSSQASQSYVRREYALSPLKPGELPPYDFDAT